MLPRSHLESESRSSAPSDVQLSRESRQCPSCHDIVDIVLQTACRCGYRVCSPCWKIAANFGGACPACGWPPDAEAIEERGMRLTSGIDNRSRSSSSSGSNTPHAAELPSHQQQHHQTQQPVSQSLTVRSNGQQQGVFIRGADRRVLQNLRVIQRTLVYAIGLTPTIAQASTLKQLEYFGQYGEITKLVINHHQGVSPDDPRYGSASAYITFRRQEDAWGAICSVDGFRLVGRTIRASFGTTKYCNSFLRNLPCNNPECLYLHELGDEGDRFTKDEVQLGLARHGSSFAFKEEVLGTGRGDSNGNNGRPPPPVNPVLPPPCPITPPRPPSASSAPSGGNRIVSQDTGTISSSGTGGAAVCGGGGSSYGRLPVSQSPPRGQTWYGEQGVGVVPGNSSGVGSVSGGLPAGVPGGVRSGGLVGPASPVPIGSDGRPRPRRRRGQRGRRGGGGSGSGGGSSGGSSSGGTGGSNGTKNGGGGAAGVRGNAIRVDGSVDAEVFAGRPCDPEEGCVYGPGDLCMLAPPSEWGSQQQVSVGVGGSAAGAAQAPRIHSLHPECGTFGSSGLISNNMELSGRSASATNLLGNLEGIGRPGLGLGLGLGLGVNSVKCKDMMAGVCARESGSAHGSTGSNNGNGVVVNTELCQPALKPALWGGNDASTVVGRSTGSGSLSGRSFWGGKAYSGTAAGGGRGSPLATPETLTNTPPVELSPSDSVSPPSTFPRLGGLGTQGLWNLGGLGASSSTGRDDKNMEGDALTGRGNEGLSDANGVHSHGVFQVRPPPAFFGLGDGAPSAPRHQGGMSRPGSAGGGRDLLSISEARSSQQRQDRSQSLDLGSLSLNDQGETNRSEIHHRQPRQQQQQQQQDQRWDRSEKTIVSLPVRTHPGVSRDSRVGVAEVVDASAVGGGRSTPLFLRHPKNAAHLTQCNSGGANMEDSAFEMSKALIRSPSVPPGLSFPSNGGDAGGESGAGGRRYSDDTSMYSGARYGLSSGLDHKSTSWNDAPRGRGAIGGSREVSEANRASTLGDGVFTPRRVGMIGHLQSPFTGSDQNVAAVSQEEVSPRPVTSWTQSPADRYNLPEYLCVGPGLELGSVAG